jgi:hypothetical protein
LDQELQPISPSSQEQSASVPSFEERARDLRTKLRAIAAEVRSLYHAPAFLIEELYPGQHKEMGANIELSYRHIEDATMRLGKAIQAYGRGKSVYDQ